MKRLIPTVIAMLMCVHLFAGNKVSVYPNPAIKFFKVAMTDEGIESVEVYNSLGVKVLKVNAVELTSKISVEHLKSGRYYVKVIGDETSQIIPLIIK